MNNTIIIERVAGQKFPKTVSLHVMITHFSMVW